MKGESKGEDSPSRAGSRSIGAACIGLILILPIAGCGGTDNPFRLGDLGPLEVEPDLAGLAKGNPTIELPSRPSSGIVDGEGAEALYAPRPELAPSDPPPARLSVTSDGENKRPVRRLSLVDTIALGLRQNRAIQSSYLNRVIEKFALYVEEETFVPRFDTLDGMVESDGGSVDTSTAVASYGTDLNWQTPYGTLLSASIGNALTFGEGDGDVDDGDERASADLEFSITQPLLRGGGRDVATAQLRLARLDEAQAQLALKASVIDTITTLTAAYLSYVAEERNVAIARRDLERSRDLLKANRLQVEAGRMAPNEVFQTELSVSNSELALEAALDSLSGARLQLLNLLSLDPATPIEPTLKLDPKRVAVDLDRARAIAFDHNPTLLAQRLQIEQQRVGLLLARDNMLPQVDVRASYGMSNSDRALPGAIGGLANGEDIWTVGVGLSIPLDRRNLELGRLSAAIGLEQAQLGQLDVREDLESSVRDGVRNVENGWRRYQISRRSVQLAERTLAAERAKLQAGRTTNFEVLARQASLQEAERNELNNVISYLLALAVLDQRLGTTLQTWRVDLNDRIAIDLLYAGGSTNDIRPVVTGNGAAPPPG